ncbi:FtsK-like domain-containing protein [Rosistilla carotiformis]|uniref:FtsK-like domain-containing protein n=1 Tax=Rosistilla carotiformis TaxID=2528017 RepID=A0A518JSR1_9BACT|nr:FtsK/SpoIIIE domain-containing protein [Rosistilla carotiformis]QDV68579.1 FtsK-like domain-containing protein [Rosistilla carotiformis]
MNQRLQPPSFSREAAGSGVEISVSDVRQQIYLADPSSGTGSPSCCELGSAFHRLIASLLNSSLSELSTIFSGASVDDWSAELRDFGYRRELGPFLVGNAAALHGRGDAVMNLWAAVNEATHWLAELFWDHRQRQLRDGKRFNPCELANWFQAEVPLRLELTDAAWTQPVILKGVADSVLSLPGGRRCVIEYKLGKTAPQADLCQTTLYHQMLNDAGNSSLAVIGFLPKRSERLIEGDQIGDLQQQLKTLIGKLAGVDRPRVAPLPQRKPAPTATPVVSTSNPTTEADVQSIAKRLKAALNEADCESNFVGEPIIGPTFIRFTVNPARGVSPKKYLSIGDLLQIRLQSNRPPVIQTGAAITIDVQRPDRQFVAWDDIDLPASDPLHGCAKVLVGVGLDGKVRTADLADTTCSHLLVAGVSGSGKSEWLRTAVAGLIATNTPEQLQLVAIDPKRVAFHDLQGSPYLRCPVVFPGDADADIIAVLDELIEEMEERYASLDGCASLAEWINRHGKPVPRIVCVCDEYADIMLASTKQQKTIESRITRLGSKGRACGIHLILATQQPSRRTITGPIQSNLPGRVGLTMTSATESRMLFEQRGAEDLLMKGDLMFKDIGAPQRYQAVYLSDDQRRAIYLSSTRNVPTP